MKEAVKSYYGKELGSSNDLKTNACCIGGSLPTDIREILSDIEPEILSRFYGCGSPIPEFLSGKTVLDLGCGTGRDVYIISKLVGENGSVIGVDMTPEQLTIAEKYRDSQAQRFGYAKPNVSFVLGDIEDLQNSGIQEGSVDVIVSNCVINLATDKKKVFREIYRVLKEGGELYFSDVFTDARIPTDIQSDPILYGECLSGALYIEDFRRILLEVGFLDYRVVKKTPITINNPEIEKKLAGRNFYSLTVRAFKLKDIEDKCEDYGQVVIYRGTIPNHSQYFDLDDHHRFFAHKPMLVCGNTYAMVMDTRFAPHFEGIGNRDRHFGLFDCGGGATATTDGSACSTGACC